MTHGKSPKNHQTWSYGCMKKVIRLLWQPMTRDREPQISATFTLCDDYYSTLANTVSSAAPHIPLCLRILELNPELSRLWHWKPDPLITQPCRSHPPSARSHPLTDESYWPWATIFSNYCTPSSAWPEVELRFYPLLLQLKLWTCMGLTWILLSFSIMGRWASLVMATGQWKRRNFLMTNGIQPSVLWHRERRIRQKGGGQPKVRLRSKNLSPFLAITAQNLPYLSQGSLKSGSSDTLHGPFLTAR